MAGTAGSNLNRHTLALRALLGLFLLSVPGFLFYFGAKRQIDQHNLLRFQSAELARELRQSSDDLTRMVRTYVATGELRYKQQFQEVLDIRDGRAPRPLGYHNVYWDLVLSPDQRPSPMGEAVSLLELMRRVGITSEEFAKLAEAKTRSDDLTATEFEAMALAEAATAGAARDEAIRLLHGPDYHRAKAEIMRPIAEFQEMIDKRTQAAVENAIERAYAAAALLIAIFATTVYLWLRSLSYLHRILGCPPKQLYESMAVLGRGDFSLPIVVPPGRNDSVLGWLSETQGKLAAIDQARRVSEREANDSEQRFRDMVNTTDGIVWEADARTFQFTFVSKKAERLLGFPLSDWKKPGFWVDNLHPDDKSWAPQFCASCTGRLEPHDFEYRFIAQDGRVVWLRDIVTVVSEGGAPRWLRGIMIDISTAKHAAKLLEDQNEALLRSNAELEAYAYVASHDLREPLRNVTAFSTMLARRLEGRLHGDEPELLRIITDAASRMDALVRDLLEVSRVGRSELPMRPVALSTVLTAALGSLRMQIEASGATVAAPADLPEVLGNEEELYRVFLNLIANALKYRREVPPDIRIDCVPEGDAAWRLGISDNGIGIETGQGYEERIFGLFQRLHKHDEHGGGTGIGLPICRKIVNRHGGRIWAESDGPGKGTSFFFTLPRR